MLKSLRSPTTIIVLLAGLSGLALVLYAWRLPPFPSSVEMTENAYVRGYLTVMSPQLSGYVAEVPVHDYEEVKAGQLLVRIDDRIYAQKLAQSEATLAAQKASHCQFASAGTVGQGRYCCQRRRSWTARRLRSTERAHLGTESGRWRRRASRHAAKPINRAQRSNRHRPPSTRPKRGWRFRARHWPPRLAPVPVCRLPLPAPRPPSNWPGSIWKTPGSSLPVTESSARSVRASANMSPPARNCSPSCRMMFGSLANFKETQLDGMKAGQPVDHFGRCAAKERR